MKLIMFVLLSIATVCFAQNEPQAAGLQKKLAEYKAERVECADRAEKLVGQLKKMDVTIEGDIAKALEFVERYTDSVDSDEKVMDFKEDIIRDLMKSTERFAELREDVVRELAADRSYVEEDMIKIRDWIDEKVKLRIKQITAVTVSLGGYEHYSAGMNYGDGGRGRRGGRFGDSSDDEALVDSLVERSADEKKDVIGKMKKAIEDLSERSEKLEKELASPRANKRR